MSKKWLFDSIKKLRFQHFCHGHWLPQEFLRCWENPPVFKAFGRPSSEQRWNAFWASMERGVVLQSSLKLIGVKFCRPLVDILFSPLFKIRLEMRFRTQSLNYIVTGLIDLNIISKLHQDQNDRSKVSLKNMIRKHFAFCWRFSKTSFLVIICKYKVLLSLSIFN